MRFTRTFAMLLLGLLASVGLFLGWLARPVQAAVTLVYFSAEVEPAPAGSSSAYRVRLEWETATEVDNIGFYIRRGQGTFSNAAAMERIQVDECPQSSSDSSQPVLFIPARGDTLGGAIYAFCDPNVTPGQAYFYVLEDIDLNNVSGYHGPELAPVGTQLPTQSPTSTLTRTPTPTPSLTITPNPSLSPTVTRTPTRTPTRTRTPVRTPTRTRTPFRTPARTSTPFPTFPGGYPPPVPTLDIPTAIINPQISPNPTDFATPGPSPTADILLTLTAAAQAATRSPEAGSSGVFRPSPSPTLLPLPTGRPGTLQGAATPGASDPVITRLIVAGAALLLGGAVLVGGAALFASRLGQTTGSHSPGGQEGSFLLDDFSLQDDTRTEGLRTEGSSDADVLDPSDPR